MAGDEFAVIADVHGNAWALEAALADIVRRGVRRIVNLGDNANGPLAPARCVELLRSRVAVHVRGNGDRLTGEGGPAIRGSAAFARERLDEDARQWLRELPFSVQGEGWLAFHATRGSDERYLLEHIVHGRAALAGEEEIAARLGPTAATLILCGHTHIARLVRLADGRTIVNPGSVGLPAYADTVPVPHVVEAGSPDARYAIVRGGPPAWHIELISLPYDHAAAAAAARAAGWPDWAHWLATGRC